MQIGIACVDSTFRGGDTHETNEIPAGEFARAEKTL
jgi:hypothetical protein